MELAKGQEVKTIEHESWMNSSTIWPDGKQIAVAHLDWSLALLDAETGRTIDTMPPLASKSNIAGFPQVQFTADGAQLAVCDAMGHYLFFDMRNAAKFGAKTAEISHGRGPCELVFGPRPEQLATVGNDGRVVIWDLKSGQNLREWRHGQVSALGGGFSPDGTLLATCGADGFIRVWETASGNLTLEINTEERHPFAVVFSPNGSQLASGGGHGKVRLWDATTGEELGLQKGGPPTGRVNSVSIAPSGKQVAAAGELGVVTLWEIKANDGGHVLPDDDIDFGVRFDPRVGANFLAYFPGGDRLLAGSCNRHNSVNIWDARTYQRLDRLDGHQWPIAAAGHLKVVFGEKGLSDRVTNLL